MKFLLFFALFSLSLVSHSQTNYNKKAIELHEKAHKLMWEPGNRNQKIKQANLLLDSAIKIDPTYRLAYHRKMSNLILLKEYKRAIKMADSATKIKPVLEILICKGALLTKIGEPDAAKKAYEQAIKVGQADYVAKPTSDVLCNIAVAYLLRDGQQKALDYLKKEKTKFANDPKDLKEINRVEKILPKFTVDEILGIRPPVPPPPGVKKIGV
ncbi:tetratricopeptide repeat protein [Pedobacter sp. Hv1]|uniref:tetratricopeptide repeat protein n=1 Tax=Pedobacter sp. Hv1 TaxID=1740090 RepID=UPI0006D8A3FD|nr:hypothetical protein [Pedobacter sp. Hv1]KQC00034.1 hypothetical protein AQF98_16130 [Pedobacter sp. Hv1]